MNAMPDETPERRSFRAETLEAALRLVSDELGPDALVVRQREGVIGGVGGFFGRRCVELEVELPQSAPHPAAAPTLATLPELDWAPTPEWVQTKARAVPAGAVVDLYDTGAPRHEPQEDETAGSATGDEPESEERYGWPMPDETPRGFVPLIPEPAASPLVDTDAQPTAELDAVEPQAAAEPEPQRAPEPVVEIAEPQPSAEIEPAAETEPAAEIEVAAEIDPAAVSDVVAEPEPTARLETVEQPADEIELVEDEGELMRTLIAQAHPFTDQYATAYERTVFGRRLADAGLGDRLARDIVAEAETELRVFDPTQPFEKQVQTALARRIRVARGSRRKRRVIALVGPPGAGKTLTAARLCHAYRSQRREIAALSLQPIREAFRLVEHTRALDVPLVAADQLRTLPVELEKLEDAELLIVDTPGVRPGENDRLRTLGALLELVGADETHVLVPASLDANQVRALVESFSETLGANRIMITHLDGPGGPSAAVAASIDSKLPISFTATGVSWGMRPADPHDLAELVVA